ncbi:hypothetical protein [Roseivirga misakiensis]|uniref:SMP-30/Gluconolactonase/LRE-like region domain-containing protein n=1 Tax=Roseivirga misakiensis TaxID=1563681 RepID=A0A1E5T0Q3_9BACT|nr:hypothetical protein [Roseivirga misakiensis]OEK04962.1 hypothetical protein BFP71_16155 [Roseivirga misakiensis]
MKSPWILLLICFLALPTYAQDELSAQDYFSAAQKAYEEKDYDAFLSNMREANALRPNHPVIVPRLAAAWALTGRKIKAVQSLSQMMLMDASYDFENNSDFDNIRTHKNYKKLLALKDKMSAEEVNDEVFKTVDAAFLHPESFVVLDNGEVLLGSIREKKIVKILADGTIIDWLEETPYGVLAMKPDFEADILWVTCAAIPETNGFLKSDTGKSTVLQVRLSDAKVLQGLVFEDDSTIGDIAIDKADRIWLTNSRTPYLTRNNTDTTDYIGAFSGKQFDLTDVYFNLQGLTLSDDEKFLYVSDYIKGVFRVNLDPDGNEDNIRRVASPSSILLKGVDGLYYYDNSLIAIHNGSKPYKVMRYFMNQSGRVIEREEVINRGGASLGEPTLGQIKDGYFYYLANSPWGAYDLEFNLDLSKTKPIEIRRFKLD